MKAARGRLRILAMSVLFVGFVCTELLFASPDAGDSKPTGKMLKFLPSVLEMIIDPPPESHLRILCQVRLQGDQGYATVLTIRDDKIFIIAFSPHQLERPWVTITLRGVFVPTGESHPTDEGTMDWAYVFDRNGDGKIDFFSYLVGPLWIIPRADVDRGQLPVVKDGVMIDFLKDNREKLRNGFWHVADDNFDGTPDGIVARTVDAKGWADGWAIVGDTDFDTEFDSCRATDVDIDGPSVDCIDTKDGYRVPGKTFAGLTRLPLQQDGLLVGFNQVASECKLGAGRFHDWPIDIDMALGDEIADTNACYERSDFEACHSLALGGDARAQDMLGFMYANAQGVEKDDDEAVKWFRLSADQGYRMGLYHLGYMHQWGRSVPEDRESAVKLYLQAAEQNEAWALFALGYMYGAGDGVEKDDKKALHYTHRAAQMGHASAQANMGMRYFTGEGVKKDYVHAYAWWGLASMHGSSKAREALEMLASMMSRKQVNEAKELFLKIHEHTIELHEEQARNDARILGITGAKP